MKSLTLLRHAKSDWNAHVSSDHERTLNGRGERSARALGRFLERSELIPDAVVTSTAVRARNTVQLAAEAGNWSCPVVPSAELYDSHPEAVLAVLRAQDDSRAHVLLAGHEPTWSQMASQLIGGGNVQVVTATLVHIEMPVATWRDVAWGRGLLRWMLPPRLLIASGMDDG